MIFRKKLFTFWLSISCYCLRFTSYCLLICKYFSLEFAKFYLSRSFSFWIWLNVFYKNRLDFKKIISLYYYNNSILFFGSSCIKCMIEWQKIGGPEISIPTEFQLIKPWLNVFIKNKYKEKFYLLFLHR